MVVCVPKLGSIIVRCDKAFVQCIPLLCAMIDHRTCDWKRLCVTHAYRPRICKSTTYGAFQWAGEHRDYDFSGEFRSSDVTIGEHRFEVVKIITLPLENGIHRFLIS